MPVGALMTALESSPEKYEAAMDRLTLGRIGAMKREIAAGAVGAGSRVLELGCGAGTLAILLARRGAAVVGLDASERMVALARRRVAEAGLAGDVQLRHLSVMEIDSLPRGSFDRVVATMLLSELSEEEIAFVLHEARRLLVPGGELVIGDELAPHSRLGRAALALVRLPFRLAAHLFAEARMLSPCGGALRLLYFCIEFPLMLLVFFVTPPPSRPLRDLEGALGAARFRPTSAVSYLGGSMQLVRARAV